MPSHIHSLNETDFMNLIDHTSNITFMEPFQHHQNWTFAGKLYSWLGQKTNKYEKLTSIALNLASNYKQNHDFCRFSNEFKHSNLQTCRNLFTFFRPHEEYDNILEPVMIQQDYEFRETANNDFWMKHFAQKIVLYFALLAYFMEIIFPKNLMILIIWVGTMFFSSSILLYPNERLSTNYLSQLTYAA